MGFSRLWGLHTYGAAHLWGFALMGFCTLMGFYPLMGLHTCGVAHPYRLLGMGFAQGFTHLQDPGWDLHIYGGRNAGICTGICTLMGSRNGILHRDLHTYRVQDGICTLVGGHNAGICTGICTLIGSRMGFARGFAHLQGPGWDLHTYGVIMLGFAWGFGSLGHKKRICTGICTHL